MLTHIDLFSGIGGFALAAKWSGFNTIFFSEINPFCCKVLKKHWPEVPNLGDIKSINSLEHCTLMTGGFPCQPFSLAGKQKGNKDERYLWNEFYRVIRLSKPDWIVIENVSGIVAMELDNILNDLEKENYETTTFIIPACAVQAPHKRDRVWIIAHTSGIRCNLLKRYWEERFISINKKWDNQKIYEEWQQFKPKSWKTYIFPSYSYGFSSNETNKNPFPLPDKGNTRLGHTRSSRVCSTESYKNEDKSPVPGMDDGLPDWVDRNKSLGNAIVPQLAYAILKSIYLLQMQEN